MKFILFSIFFAGFVLAKDSSVVDHSGIYHLKGEEVCVRYALLMKCVKSTETDFSGKTVSIFVSGTKDSPIVCVEGNFDSGIGRSEGCYGDNKEQDKIRVTGSGIKASRNTGFVNYYSELNRQGSLFTLKDGGETRGVHMYAIYTLEKAQP